MLLLQQMVVLFIYMVIGYETCKKGILDEETGNKISWLVVNIATPAMAISAVVNGDGRIPREDLILTTVIAAITFALLLLLAQIFPYIFRVEKEERSVYKMMTAFNNIGFMGYPVIVAAYGEEALLYAVIFSMMFNVLIYTYGIQTLRGTSGAFELKKIINVGVVSSIIAIVLYLTQIPVPQFVKTASGGLSDLTAPLSMIVIGISLVSINIREMFTDIRLLVFSAVKLLVIPILSMMVICRFVDNDMLAGVCMIMLATPAASMCVMLAQQYGGSYEAASKGVALTTVLSVVTIPIVSAVIF